MVFHDRTSMGGPHSQFMTTCWADLQAIKSDDEELKKLIVGNLIEHYWKPVYCYIRYKGYDNETAKDLTQKFFHGVVLEGELAAKADRSKGRFRTFLLRCLDHFLINEHQHRTSLKRTPRGSMIHLDQVDGSVLNLADTADSPEAAFHRVWVSQIIEEVLDAVEKNCRSSGQQQHWQVFKRRIIDPILYGEPAPSLGQLCTELALESESRASNMIITVKRSFRRVLLSILAKHNEGSDCDSEIEALVAELL